MPFVVLIAGNSEKFFNYVFCINVYEGMAEQT